MFLHPLDSLAGHFQYLHTKCTTSQLTHYHQLTNSCTLSTRIDPWSRAFTPHTARYPVYPLSPLAWPKTEQKSQDSQEQIHPHLPSSRIFTHPCAKNKCLSHMVWVILGKHMVCLPFREAHGQAALPETTPSPNPSSQGAPRL